MEESQLHIPVGWESCELGSLYLEKRKSKFKVSDATNYGGIPFYTSGDAVLEHNEIQTDGENIFLATGGIANVKFYNGNVAYSTDTYVIVGKENIDTQFLYFKILDQLYYINTNFFQGSGLKHLQKKDFKKHLFALPKTEIEQTAIASILSKTDQAIASTEALIAKYSKIKTGLMQDLLTKGIDENGNVRTEQTHEFKDSPLGRIPKEWECVDITKFTKDYNNAIKPGPFGSSVKKEYYVEKGYKIYGQEQVIANNAFIGDYYIDEKKYKSLIGFKVNKDDVLLSCVGTIGSVLIIPENFEEGIINPRLIKFSLDSKKANINFFAQYLTDASINSQLINLATGGTMPVLNKQIVLSLKFIYPKIEEQNRIVEKWEAVYSMINSEIKTLSKLQSLKTGLMQDLLSGKVRVNSMLHRDNLSTDKTKPLQNVTSSKQE